MLVMFSVCLIFRNWWFLANWSALTLSLFVVGTYIWWDWWLCWCSQEVCNCSNFSLLYHKNALNSWVSDFLVYRIRINIPPSMIFSPRRSPGAVASGVSKLKWQSPIASPVSTVNQTPISHNQSPMLRSPVSPYMQSPTVVSVSPGHLINTNSPSRFARTSPSSNKVMNQNLQ